MPLTLTLTSQAVTWPPERASFPERAISLLLDEDSIASKFTTCLPEGFDAFLTAWDNTPLEKTGLLLIFSFNSTKEEARLKRHITADVTSDTKAYYSSVFSSHLLIL